MATTTINGIANTMTSPASNDLLDIWNVAAGRLDKITRANLVGATITGGGTIALGGFTLTVPAAGTAALLAVANVFTTVQTVVPATTGVHGVAVNMPVSTIGDAFNAKHNNLNAIRLIATATSRQLLIDNFDNGAGIGPCVILGYNNNGTAAAGHIAMYERDGNFDSIWPDATGLLRIVTGSQPTSATDTSGTVVGTQTSMAAAKKIGNDLSPIDEVFSRIQQGAAAVKRFTYRTGAFGGQEFEGVVIDDAPEYGMDRDKDHPAGKSLNEINIAGDLLRFAAWAMQRIEALEANQIH